MGSIKVINKRYHARIRKKGKTLYQAFDDRETAELWMKFKENLIDEMDAFDFQAEKTITLKEAIDLKSLEFTKNNVDKKSFSDLAIILKEFSEWSNTPLNEITEDMLMDKLNLMKDRCVFRGGKQDGKSGVKVIQSSATLLRKFRMVAAIYSHLIQNGAKISNPAQHVVNRIKMSIACTRKDNDDHL